MRVLNLANARVKVADVSKLRGLHYINAAVALLKSRVMPSSHSILLNGEHPQSVYPFD